MTATAVSTQAILRRQSVGAVRLIGRYVVWRRGTDIYAVWPGRNVYSAVPPGCRYSLSQAIEVLSEMGRKVVLYFYPKDDTAGCTKEAVGFSERSADFARAGATVIGVSKDSVASHDKFLKKHELAVRLASDADGRVCENYGVWVEKSMYGRSYTGIERATFLIDEDGVVRKVWRKVKVPGHVDEVLAAVKAERGGG